jgi:hypothetical protein
MGLLSKLQTAGSILSIANGGQVSTNPLATQQSKLHADGNAPGYSVNGANASLVNSQYQQYVDGAPNILPQPSQLDLNGSTPSQYINNLPG